MTIAIHQPNYLPWLGYFAKLVLADTFVFLDHVPFSKGSYTNRVQINYENRNQWLTIPLKKFTLGTPINQITIDWSKDWDSKHVRYIEEKYKDQSITEESLSFLIEMFRELRGIELLSEYNEHWIRAICKKQGWKNQFLRSSEIPISKDNEQEVLKICEALRAKVYLSGQGGRNYLNLGAFAQKGIEVKFLAPEEWPFDWQQHKENLGHSIIHWMDRNI